MKKFVSSFLLGSLVFVLSCDTMATVISIGVGGFNNGLTSTSYKFVIDESSSFLNSSEGCYWGHDDCITGEDISILGRFEIKFTDYAYTDYNYDTALVFNQKISINNDAPQSELPWQLYWNPYQNTVEEYPDCPKNFSCTTISTFQDIIDGSLDGNRLVIDRRYNSVLSNDFHLHIEATVVPIPAAFWLFLSTFTGLLTLLKRT